MGQILGDKKLGDPNPRSAARRGLFNVPLFADRILLLAKKCYKSAGIIANSEVGNGI
jgi:hypothetical protein